MRNATIKQLRVVTAIAKAGTVTGAAGKLGLTPPAATLRLREIETDLGLPLFERAPNGMRLTAAGRHVLDAANRVEAALASCDEAIGALRGLGMGRVSIGVVSTARYFAPAALAAFKREHPEIELTLFVGNRENTIRGLAALDLDLVVMGQPPVGLDAQSVAFGDHPLVVVAPPSHPLAGRRRIKFKALGRETFLIREQGSGTRMAMERLFAESGTEPRVGMEVDSNETIKQAVMAGLGVAFISAHTVAAELDTGRLAILDVEGLPIMRQWFVARHAGKPPMPPAAALWDHLVRDGWSFLPDAAPAGRAKPSPAAKAKRRIAARG